MTNKFTTWHTGAAAKDSVMTLNIPVEKFAEQMNYSRAQAYVRFKVARWSWPEVVRAAEILGLEPQWLERGVGPKLLRSKPTTVKANAMVQRQISEANRKIQRILEELTENVTMLIAMDVRTVESPYNEGSDEPPHD